MMLVILYGCCSSSKDGFFVNPQSDEIITSREVVIDELGRLPTVTFPSGAKIEGLEENTLTPGIVVTIIERKFTAQNTSYFNKTFEGGVYIYKITAVQNPSSPLESKTYVNTTEKPIKVTLSNTNSPQEITFAAIKESDTDPWRLFNFTGSDVLDNIVGISVSDNTTPENSFNIFRFGTQFAITNYEGDSGNKLPETIVTSLSASSTASILVKNGKYIEDLNLKGILKGVKLDSIKPTDLRARITYRNNMPEETKIKVNGVNVSQTNKEDKTVPGYSYCHSFVVDSVNDPNIMSNEGEYSFTINLNGIETEYFPSSFLIEFYNKVDSEKILLYNYTEFYTLNKVEDASLVISSVDGSVADEAGNFFILNPMFKITSSYEFSEEDKKKIAEAIKLSNVDLEKIKKSWEGRDLYISFAEDLQPDTLYTISMEEIPDLENAVITPFEEFSFTTESGVPVIPIESYNIDYMLYGGLTDPENPKTYTNASETFTLVNPTKPGYSFSGWTGSNGDTPQMEVTIESGSTENRTYTANFSPTSYSITYNNVENCTFTVDNPASYDITSATITLNEPTKTGTEFLGWTSDDITVPQKTGVQIAQGSTGDKTFTANWNINLNFAIAPDDGMLIDDVNNLYYTKSSFTVTPTIPAGLVLSDSEKADIIGAIRVKDSASNSVNIATASWNNENKIALTFNDDLNASSTFSIAFDKVDGMTFNCATYTFKTFYYKGRGTNENRYQVENAAQLDLVRNYLNKHFLQTADVDIATYAWIGIGNKYDVNMNPIAFTGSYYGNGKKIKNLKCRNPEAWNPSEEWNSAGIFCYVENNGLDANSGKIASVTVDGVSVKGSDANPDEHYCSDVGIIADCIYENCSIENCKVTDSLNGGSLVLCDDELDNEHYLGGICAYCDANATIRNCSVENLTFVGKDGGIGGFGGICYSNVGSIENCTISNVTINTHYIGGICYFNYGNLSQCNLSDSTLEATGDDSRIGGICKTTNANITDCSLSRTTLKADGAGCQIGGIRCEYEDNPSISNCNISNSSFEITNGGNSSKIGGIAPESNSTISYCSIDKSSFTLNGGENSAIGGVITQGTGNISQCHITETTFNLNGGNNQNCYLGGICCNPENEISECYLTDCKFEETSGYNSYLAGISCLSYGISKCYVKGTSFLLNGYANANTYYIGGICGDDSNNNISECYVSESSIEGEDCHDFYGGGIIGRLGCEVDDCYVLNTFVKLSGDSYGYTGGIVGFNYASVYSSYFYYDKDNEDPVTNVNGDLGLLEGNKDRAGEENCFSNKTGILVGDRLNEVLTNCYDGIDTYDKFTTDGVSPRTWSDGAWDAYNVNDTNWPPNLKNNPRQQ